MTFPGRFLLLAGALFCTASSIAQTAPACEAPWPPKVVRIVSPYPPGGSADMIARQIASRLGERLHSSFIVENRPGAGGNIASEWVVRAAADGSVLLLGVSGPIAINPSLYKRMSFQPQKDLKPVMLLASEPYVLYVNPSTGIRTVGELVAQLKAKPAAFSYASAGPGSTAQLAAERFRAATGTQMMHVPYKGGVPALTDVVAGVVPLTFAAVTGYTYANAGKLNALAITGPNRSAFLPKVPTLREAGIGDADTTIWYGLLAPAGTSGAIVERIRRETAVAMAQPEVQKALRDYGIEDDSKGSSEDFRHLIETETLRWSRIVQATGTTLD